MTTDYTSFITSEHADKPKFVAMVQATAGAFGAIAEAMCSLPHAFDLDNAAGAQLDIVGKWVGQPRAVSGVLTLGYFGFSDNIVAEPFGEEGNPSIGGRFYEEGEPFTSTSVLADPEYRTVLRAKIVRNHYDGRTDEIEQALEYIFAAPAHVRDAGNLSIDIVVNAPISLVGQSLLTNFDLLPRPAGVSIGEIIHSELSAEARAKAAAAGTL